MATWEDVRALGYTLGEAQPGVYYVEGNGLATYIKADDQEQIDSLADPVLHAQRVTPQAVTVTASTPNVSDVVQQPDGTYGIVVSVANGTVEVAPLAPAVITEASSLTIPTA